MMNKKERLEAFFNNEEMDHVPVGLWRHFPPEESHGQAYIDAQMKFYRETDQDFVKISCDGYFGFPNPVLENLEKPEDLFDIKPLGKDHPFIAEQVLRGADIVKALAGECMCFYTMFCPLSYLRLQVGWDKMMECIRANPKAVKFACDVIAEDVKALVKGLIEAGVDGVFYAVQNAEINRFTVEEYKNWVMPSDKKVLDYANVLGKRNILHCCGWEDVRNNLEVWEDYESAAVNWAAYTEQLDVPHAKEFFRRPIWGGFDNKEKGILYKGTKKEIQEETKNLIRQGGKKGFMLGPDCSLPNGIDIEHIKWVVEAARDV